MSDEDLDAFEVLSNRIDVIQGGQLELSGKVDQLTRMFEAFIQISTSNSKSSPTLSELNSDNMDNTPYPIKNLRFKGKVEPWNCHT